ncbi:dynein light chain Tctex-type 5-like [Leucoraja erinacea]|uniref:dynein light chain Tctex-type 5-like n=1 Tax=Leucoraja erinaceus TaxID=7782 RepID=UPI002458C5E7|nr:dynein light chain Tctex-type 5-like [Leucoraja erinacea]
MDSRKQSLVTVRVTEKRAPVSTKARTNSKAAPEGKYGTQPGALKGRGSMGNILSEGHPPSFSISGLLVARRLTKNLKERTALKIAAKKPVVTKIINEQVPPFSSKPPQKFCSFAVQRFLEELLPGELSGISYGPDLAGKLAKEMSEKIKEFAKTAMPPRYKLVCIVTVGEHCQEDVLLTSRALWDAYADTFVSHSYKNGTMFCVASVFALYCE